jgi:hypothetical protein
VLVVDFYSDASEGVLTIYAGERQVLREPFHFFKKTGVFKTEPMSGRIEARRRLSAGPSSIRIYLSRGDRAAQVTTLDGDFPGGGERVLKIRVSKDGQVTRLPRLTRSGPFNRVSVPSGASCGASSARGPTATMTTASGCRCRIAAARISSLVTSRSACNCAV